MKYQHFSFLMIHRGDLQSVLLAAVRRLKPDAIRMASRIVDFAQDDKGVTALFANGSRAPGSVLVGADGVHSLIRNALFGAAKATYPGCSAGGALLPRKGFRSGFGYPRA
jgi:salicylate hydroxylase